MKHTLSRSVLLVTALVGVLVGCSSGGADDSAGGTAGASSAELPALARDNAAYDSDAAGSRAELAKADGLADNADLGSRALIKKGNVSLRTDEVGAAQAAVQQVADRYAGQVSSEKSQSDEDGRPAYARMVLRVPADDFAAAVTALKDIGELESASTNEDDVTDEVIDVRTRLRVQQRSIARITVLFERAENIRDIMAIEAQLAQRQADLESLQRRADHLANQTSLATIVVNIDRTPAATKPKQDDRGFLAGLSAGWGALTAFAVGLATAAGVALPWAVAIAIVGVPVLLLVRALRRRAPGLATATATADADADADPGPQSSE